MPSSFNRRRAAFSVDDTVNVGSRLTDGDRRLVLAVIDAGAKDRDHRFFWAEDSPFEFYAGLLGLDAQAVREGYVKRGKICTEEEYRKAIARRGGWFLYRVTRNFVEIATRATNDPRLHRRRIPRGAA